MKELKLSKEQLIKLFEIEDIKDTNNGWLYMNNHFVDIIAIHDKDPKYVYNITNAEYYKIKKIEI